MGTLAGIEYGMAKEFVYFSSSTASYYKVSELDWPLQPAYYSGARLSLRTRHGLSAELSLRAAIPTRVGYMEDFDYLNGDGILTNYSHHSSYLERSLGARADLGWRLPVTSEFALTPYARFAVMDIKWSARDGYYQYPPQTSPPYSYWNASDPKTYLYGPIAYYEQIYLIPAVGVHGEYRANPKLSFAASLAFSPLVWINDIDNHLLRSLTFYDAMALSTYFEPSVSLSFRPSTRMELTFDLAYLSVVSPSNGTITTEDTTTGTQTTSAGSGSTAGASIGSISTTLGIHLHP